MKKIIIWSLVVIAAGALIMWKLGANKKANLAKTEFVKESNSGDVPVLVEKVTKTDFSQGFLANGNFTPVRELTYLAEIAGRITRLTVMKGTGEAGTDHWVYRWRNPGNRFTVCKGQPGTTESR